MTSPPWCMQPLTPGEDPWEPGREPPLLPPRGLASLLPPRPAILALAAALGLLVGCSDPTTGTISGVVRIDGVPAQTGSVALLPVNRKGRTAGSEIVNGRYSAVASLGEMRVEIRVPRVVGQTKLYDAPDSPMKAIMEESLPPRYNDDSELTVTIAPGETVRDFDLTTK